MNRLKFLKKDDKKEEKEDSKKTKIFQQGNLTEKMQGMLTQKYINSKGKK